MLAQAIEGSIAYKYIKKLKLHQRDYEWDHAKGLTRNYGPTMIYVLFKIIKPDTMIGV